jgi:hypothetical protein
LVSSVETLHCGERSSQQTAPRLEIEGFIAEALELLSAEEIDEKRLFMHLFRQSRSAMRRLRSVLSV